MKKTKLLVKIVGAIVAILIICVITVLIVWRNQIATVRSIKQIDEYPILTMDYKGTYWFDDFMKTEGMISGEDFMSFFNSKLSHGIIKNKGAMGERSEAQCTCFVCRDENGNVLYCRNSDTTNGKYCPPVIITEHDGTYSSVGAAVLFGAPEGAPEVLKRINMLAEPYYMCDGMNEAGVAVSLLSVPFSEAPKNENVPVLDSEQICRLILNEASDVDKAIALFDTFNPASSMLKINSASHFFIADKSGRAVVVELYDGRVEVVESLQDNYMTVTNFYLNSYTLAGTGQARYKYVEEALEEAGGVLSTQEAFELLASVKDPYIHTEWTCIYNLTTGEMHIMPKSQLDHIHKIEYSFD